MRAGTPEANRQENTGDQKRSSPSVARRQSSNYHLSMGGGKEDREKASKVRGG